MTDEEKLAKLKANPALQEWQTKGYFEWCEKTSRDPRATDLERLKKLSNNSSLRRTRRGPYHG